MSLPLLDLTARWTGPLLATADGAFRDDAWADAWREYLQTGEAPEGMDAGAEVVTMRPLSSAEMAQCEAEAGPPAQLAAFLLQTLAGEPGTIERARALAALPDEDQTAIHRAELRGGRLMLAQARRALVDATFAPEGTRPGDVLELLPDHVRSLVLVELCRHLARIGTLGAEGKARAGQR